MAVEAALVFVLEQMFGVALGQVVKRYARKLVTA